ncbi:N-acetyl-D-glucosamine kinase [Bienertia sinuspersici]
MELGSIGGRWRWAMAAREAEARDTLEHVIDEALSKVCSDRAAVRAICLAVSGVNHPKDQEKLFDWMSFAVAHFLKPSHIATTILISYIGLDHGCEWLVMACGGGGVVVVAGGAVGGEAVVVFGGKSQWKIFSDFVQIFVFNDAVAALASGTMGKLHGCVLISGTGSISYGVKEDGNEARAGGGGPILGDWGSSGLDSSSQVTYADSSWARIAALAPVVISCAEMGDEIANKILVEAVEELAICVKSVVQRLHLCGEDKNGPFPVVLVGGILEANAKWDIAKETMNCIRQDYPGAYPIRPKVEPAVGAALLALNLFTQGGIQKKWMYSVTSAQES